MSTATAEHMEAEQPGMPAEHASLLGNIRHFAGGLIEQQIDKLTSHVEPEGDSLDLALVEVTSPPPTYADAGVHFLKRINGVVFGTREKAKSSQEEAIPLEVIAGKIKAGKTSHEYTMFRREDGENNGRFIYILSGLTGSQAAYKRLAEELAKQGETVVTSQEASGKRPNTDGRHYTSPQEIASEGAIAVAKEIMEKFGYERLVFICHSLGGGTGTDAALQMYELVESKGDLESLGLTDATFWEMLNYTKDSLVKEFAPAIPQFAMSEDGLELGWQTLKRTLLRPVRFPLEAAQAGRANYRPKNEKLRELAQHMGQFAVHAEGSAFFPINNTEDRAGYLYDEFLKHPRPDADHLFPIRYPITTARAIVDGLKKVGKRKPLPDSSEQVPEGELVAA
jgi:pimeloyl-ACP methyl ester carboxylesterase